MSQAPVESRELMERAKELVEASRRKLAEVQARDHAPIAVTGRAFRFPGGCDDPETLWQLLARAGDASEEVPADRWDARRIYASARIQPGKSSTSRGGFVKGVERFDAAFFGISPREARELDPQQRLLLEVVWWALEDALLPPASLRGSATGVFVGICSSDYYTLAMRRPLEQLSGYSGTGMGRGPAAGRLSYLLGLRGPALAIDTACSSSLVALHLAVQSLRRGECERAIVAGTSLMLEESTHVAFSQAGMLSPDGRCKTFSDAADGYARADGVAALLLERRDVLERSGRQPLAWVCGSAVNQDGAVGGLTVPNGPAQQEVVRAALADARLAPGDITFVEAHGTGTALGDLIEVNALAATFAERARPLALGSLKANLGHMEATAGIGGVIKVIEQLRRRRIPAAPRFGALNRRVAWARLPVSIPETTEIWGGDGETLRAGVSSFGFSGTNAHVVLSSVEAAPPGALADGSQVLPLSARDPDALGRLCQQYAQFLEQTSLDLRDVCSAAQLGRDALHERLAVVVETPAQGARALREGAGSITASRPAGASTKLAWLFTGQGAQRPGMGRELYQRFPSFRQALQHCASVLAENGGFELLPLLLGDAEPELIHRTAFAQPALFAYEWALAQLWLACGLRPDVVVGHSVGELVAACVAGVFSVEDGLRLVQARAGLMQALPAGGKMLAVNGRLDTLAVWLGEHSTQVSVAAVNAEDQLVLSGDGGLLDELAKLLDTRGVRHGFLQVSHAFHSPLMEPMLAPLEAAAQRVRFGRPRLPLVSCVSGELADDEVACARYWREHVSAPVQWARAVECLKRLSVGIFLEVGPSPVLVGLARRALTQEDLLWLPSAQAGAARAVFERSLARLWVEGFDVRWQAVQGNSQVPRVALPRYPFASSSYWLEGADTARKSLEDRHPLLGASVDMDGRVAYEVSLRGHDYLGEHRVFGSAVFPATGYAELLLSVAQRARPAGYELSSLEVERPLGLDALGALDVRVVCVGHDSAQGLELEVVRRSATGDWLRLCRGLVARLSALPPAAPPPSLADGRRVDVAALRARNLKKGLDHGDRFWALCEAVAGDGWAEGRLALDAGVAGGASTHVVHPVLLDGCFQVAMCLTESTAELFLPVSIGRLCVHRAGAAAGICRVELHAESRNGLRELNLTLRDEQGALLLEAQGVRARAVSREAMLRALGAARGSLLIQRELEPVPKMNERWTPPRLVVFGPPSAVRGALASAARAQGIDVHESDQPTSIPAPPPPQTMFVYALPAEATGETHAIQGAIWRVVEIIQQLSHESTPASLCVVADAQAELTCAALAALLGSASKELVWLKTQLIRLAPFDAAAVSPALLEQLLSATPLAELELGAAGCVAPRYRGLSLPALDPEIRLPADRSYLVSGGLGALGLACAKQLVARGARSLVLLHRSPPGSSAQATLEELRRAGVQITLARVDVTSGEQVRHLFAEVLAGLPKLAGIVHAAGVRSDRLLPQLERATFDQVFSPKASGAWHLHQCSLEIELDFFVLFSSLAAVFGSAGQGHYAAANAFCDGLAQLRRRQGRRALSIQWGPWDGPGMASELSALERSRLEQAGLRFLPAPVALDYFDRLLLAEAIPPVVVVADIAWDVAAARWLGAGQRASLAPMLQEVTVGVEESPTLRALRTAEPGQRRSALARYLAAELAHCLGHPSDSAPPPLDASFASLGVDSLAALELSSRLERGLGAPLPASLDFGGMTLRRLGELLLTFAPPAPRSPEPPPTTSTDSVEIGPRHRDDAVEQAWRGHHVTLGGLRWGRKSAAPVLLVHGIRAHAACWAPLVQALRRLGSGDLLAPDLRGHGRSGHGPAGHPLDPLDLLRDLDAIVRVEAHEPIVLVGHSFGCSVSALYATLRPERVRGLVLIEPVLPLLRQPRTEASLLRSALDASEATLRKPEHPVLRSQALAVELVQREYPGLPPAYCVRMAERVLARGDDGWRWTWDPALREFDRFAAPFLDGETVVDWFARLTMPVKFVVANQSPFPTRTDAERLVRRVARGSILELPGSHQLHAEAPGPIADAIAELRSPERRAPTPAAGQVPHAI